MFEMNQVAEEVSVEQRRKVSRRRFSFFFFVLHRETFDKDASLAASKAPFEIFWWSVLRSPIG